jgi:DNA-binding response OmpR family regulator
MMPIRILLVEDSPTQAAISKRDLESIGPDVMVDVVYTAADAMQWLFSRNSPLDLLVLDLTLPDGSGLDICRAVKNDLLARQIPVVIFSMEALSTHRQAAYNAGADHYISKGSTGDTTLRLVASTLLRKKLRKLPRLGEALVSRGYLTIDQLQEALNVQESQSVLLGQLLVKNGYITANQLQEVLEMQQRGEL